MRTQEFNSKLISLLPLDEVPLHVPLRRPRPLRFERLRVGGEGKADANLTNFLSTCCAWPPKLPPRPWGGPPPPPPAHKPLTPLHKKHSPPPPAPLAIRKTPSGRRRKSRRQSHKFFKHLLRLGTPTRRQALGRLPTPPPRPENLLLRLHRKLPSAPPGSTQEVSESENRPATRGTAHSEVRWRFRWRFR